MSRRLPEQPDPVVDRQVVFEGRLIRVEVRTLAGENGLFFRREVVLHPGAAAVLTERPDGAYLWVRQYREAVGEPLLEVPAGTLEEGEDPAACARREVEEETGRRVAVLKPLGTIWTSPGFVRERIHLFYARLDDRPADAVADPDERIETVALSAEAIEQRIAEGTIADGKSLACWLRYRLLRERGWPG